MGKGHHWLLQTPLLNAIIKRQYKRHGRHYKLGVSDMVLVVFLYYRSYVTQYFLGWLFGVDAAQICRIIQKLEPILAKIVALKKEHTLSQKTVEELIMDATEQPIERPKRGQRAYYSGKKKRHTLKTEIRTTLKAQR